MLVVLCGVIKCFMRARKAQLILQPLCAVGREEACAGSSEAASSALRLLPGPLSGISGFRNPVCLMVKRTSGQTPDRNVQGRRGAARSSTLPLTRASVRRLRHTLRFGGFGAASARQFSNTCRANAAGPGFRWQGRRQRSGARCQADCRTGKIQHERAHGEVPAGFFCDPLHQISWRLACLGPFPPIYQTTLQEAC